MNEKQHYRNQDGITSNECIYIGKTLFSVSLKEIIDSENNESKIKIYYFSNIIDASYIIEKNIIDIEYEDNNGTRTITLNPKNNRDIIDIYKNLVIAIDEYRDKTGK